MILIIIHLKRQKSPFRDSNFVITTEREEKRQLDDAGRKKSVAVKGGKGRVASVLCIRNGGAEPSASQSSRRLFDVCLGATRQGGLWR